MNNRLDYFRSSYVQTIPVDIVVPCDNCGRFNLVKVAVTLEHGIEPDVSLPACRTCGTPMEPMRDDVIDTALYCVTHGEV